MEAIVEITENLEASSRATIATVLGSSIDLRRAYPTDMQAAFASLNSTSDANGSTSSEETFRKAGLSR